ncbi:Trp biosynthesis-associated membrane protein [Gordonia sp. X0973]|uniref:Trp biosynthesis-associated membrane protein n=1 Tax=Gordonia sp. X0973 TaxID=2742602 RepID=UPI000F521565|nr:Trp biosynthesis-associated membrane protein [Gordonia sp. X0973]QKT07528.1 Trp biosynthesis-associated membrane protein [Gordonia sp. X0973]
MSADRSATRGKAVASLLLALGAALLWVASRVNWARIEATDGLSPQRRFDVTGAQWSPWLVPLALVLLASIALVWSLRGWALRLLAIVLALCAVVAAIPAIALLTGPPDTDYAAKAIDLAPRFRVLLTTPTPWAPVLVLVAAVFVAGGAVFALRAARGAGMSSKYRSPAARREELERRVFAEHERRQRAAAAGGSSDGADAAAPGAPTKGVGGLDDGDGGHSGSERILWDSLDTGVDPTE